MSKENDRITENIACIDTGSMRATLISTLGSHCEVWRSIGAIFRDHKRICMDIVIKRHIQPCSFAEVRVLNKEYLEVKSKLGDIVPTALFVSTQIDGADNVVVIAETVMPWFNIANSANESVVIPLLRQLSGARSQLQKFVAAAKAWCEGDDPKIIDLYGIDNLVLDVNYDIKYIDSFGVFFYQDLLHLFEEVDQRLKDKMDISLQRIDYLDYVISQSRVARVPGFGF